VFGGRSHGFPIFGDSLGCNCVEGLSDCDSGVAGNLQIRDAGILCQVAEGVELMDCFLNSVLYAFLEMTVWKGLSDKV
jgi:hypothetical protein